MGNICSNSKQVKNLQEQLDILADEYDHIYNLFESAKYDLKKSNNTILHILDINNVDCFLKKNQNDMLEDQFERHYITKYHTYLFNKYSLLEDKNPFVNENH